MRSFQNGGNQKAHLVALGSIGEYFFTIECRPAYVVAKHIAYVRHRAPRLDARGVELLKLGNVVHDRVDLRRECLQLIRVPPSTAPERNLSHFRHR